MENDVDIHGPSIGLELSEDNSDWKCCRQWRYFSTLGFGEIARMFKKYYQGLLPI
jgi:hypothetical protein